MPCRGKERKWYLKIGAHGRRNLSYLKIFFNSRAVKDFFYIQKVHFFYACAAYSEPPFDISISEFQELI